MNKNILTAFAVMISLTVIIWSGCKKDNGPNIEEFIIQIDSMVHLDTINSGDTLNIKFYGLIGPNGCYAFDEFALEYSPDDQELAIESIGIHTFNDMCANAMVYMNGRELEVDGFVAGEYVITAIQPDGSSLSQNVYVKE